MPYIKKTVVAGDTVEVYKTYSGRIGKKIPRSPNQSPTRAAVQEINRRNAETKLRWVLNANYVAKDIHLVLTYRKEYRPPPDVAVQQLAAFVRGMRKVYKKHGLVCKYVANTSYGSPAEEDADDPELTAMHHHLVIKSIDIRELIDLWPYGALRPTYLYQRWGVNEFGKLAAYIIRQTDKIYNLPDSPCRRRYNSSRNLVIPKPDVEIIPAGAWSSKPRAEQGYTLVPDSVRSWRCAITGLPCQSYMMVRKPPPQEDKPQKQRAGNKKPAAKAGVNKKPNKNRRC